MNQANPRTCARFGLRVVSTGVLALAVSGCGMFGWFGGERLPPLPVLVNSAPVKVVWQASVGRANGYTFTPVLSQGVVYAAGYDGEIAALGDGSGRATSRLAAGQRITSGVGVGDGRVVVGSEKGEVIALDATGKQVWKSVLAGELLAAPTVLPGAVLARTADGRVFSLNPLDGKRRWVYQRSTPALTLRSSAGLLVHRNTVYAGFPGGKLVALELESGKPIWEATLSLPRGATELERIADIAGAPVQDETRICAAVYQGRSGCVETLNGNVLWSREVSGATGMAVDSKNLYFADEAGNVFALDKVSGASVWKQEQLARRKPGTPVVFQGSVWVGDMNGLLHGLSVDNGSLNGRVATDGSQVKELVLRNDTLIAQTERGGVFAIR